MGKRYDVLVCRENGDKKYWTKIGSGFVNKDDSIGIKLDALPLNGDMLLKIPLSKEEWEAKKAGGGGGQSRNRFRRGQSEPQQVGDGNLFAGRKAPSYPKDADGAFGDDDGAFE